MASAADLYDRIIALDLGKFNSVGRDLDVRARQHQFAAVETTPAALRAWLAGRLAGLDPARVLVVFETCDCAGWVHDLVTPLGVAVAVANPAHEAWRWTKVKRKTDRDDALKLAKLALLDQLPTVHVPPPDARQRRRLVHYRRALVGRRTQVKNQVRSIFSQQGLPLARGTKQWTRAGVAELAAHARPLADCGVPDLWRGRLHAELALLAALAEQVAAVDARLDALATADGRVALLRTVPGVGPRLAETVVVHLDDPHRFKTAGQVGSYAGLVPKQMESGQTSRRGRVTRRGPSLLRGMLVEVAWVVVRHNAWARAFVDRVSRGSPGRRKQAVVALARKLLVILWSMLRRNEPWRDPAAGPALAPALTT